MAGQGAQAEEQAPPGDVPRSAGKKNRRRTETKLKEHAENVGAVTTDTSHAVQKADGSARKQDSARRILVSARVPVVSAAATKSHQSDQAKVAKSVVLEASSESSSDSGSDDESSDLSREAGAADVSRKYSPEKHSTPQQTSEKGAHKSSNDAGQVELEYRWTDHCAPAPSADFARDWHLPSSGVVGDIETPGQLVAQFAETLEHIDSSLAKALLQRAVDNCGAQEAGQLSLQQQAEKNNIRFGVDSEPYLLMCLLSIMADLTQAGAELLCHMADRYEDQGTHLPSIEIDVHSRLPSLCVALSAPSSAVNTEARAARQYWLDRDTCMLAAQQRGKPCWARYRAENKGAVDAEWCISVLCAPESAAFLTLLSDSTLVALQMLVLACASPGSYLAVIGKIDKLYSADLDYGAKERNCIQWLIGAQQRARNHIQTGEFELRVGAAPPALRYLALPLTSAITALLCALVQVAESRRVPLVECGIEIPPARNDRAVEFQECFRKSWDTPPASTTAPVKRSGSMSSAGKAPKATGLRMISDQLRMAHSAFVFPSTPTQESVRDWLLKLQETVDMYDLSEEEVLTAATQHMHANSNVLRGWAGCKQRLHATAQPVS